MLQRKGRYSTSVGILEACHADLVDEDEGGKSGQDAHILAVFPCSSFDVAFLKALHRFQRQFSLGQSIDLIVITVEC